MLSLIGSGQLVTRFEAIEDKVDEIMNKIDRLLRHFNIEIDTMDVVAGGVVEMTF